MALIGGVPGLKINVPKKTNVMKYKYLLFVVVSTLSVNYSVGQDSLATEKPKKIHINFLLRSSLEIPDDSRPASIKMNEVRVEVLGTILPDLEYRFRYRLNRSHTTTSQDNAAAAIDIASVNYKFGKNKDWSVNVGKQAAFVGSWEFEHNPTYEYQYSEFIGKQTNIFLMAIKLGYQVNQNHAFYLQVHNTYNEDFSNIHSKTGYSTNGLKSAKTPMGIYAVWQGKLFDEKLRTFWSYNLSKYAEGDLNHAVALGQKLQLRKFQAYLDIQSATLNADYPDIASPAINNYNNLLAPGTTPVFARDINYKGIVLRLDYEFLPKWFLTAKGFYETAGYSNNNVDLKNNFRQNIGYLTGLEFKPFADKNFKIFGYYFNNVVQFRQGVATANTREELNLFSAGLLYFINAL